MSDLEQYIRKTVIESKYVYVLTLEQLEWFVDQSVKRFENIHAADPGLWPIGVDFKDWDSVLQRWLCDYADNLTLPETKV